MHNIFDLTGKIALITGGAGGIGSAIAEGLAEHGAHIMVADMNTENFEPSAGKIRAMGRQARSVSMDITSKESVEDMVKSTLDHFSQIDILINAAGTKSWLAADDMPVDEWQRVMDVNIRGTFISCKTVGHEMIKQKRGIIINLSSVRGRFGSQNGNADYCTSKGAVDALTRALACEWSGSNIRVNAIAPTVVETEFVRRLFDNPGTIDYLEKRIPLGRCAVTEDLIGPVVFLASEASRYITGQILYVDGGMTART